MKKSHSVRTIILAGSLLLQLNTLCFQSRGAAGDVDLSFDPGSGVNGTVSAVVVQPDGKVIIGGAFTTVKGLACAGIARLNADGSGDSTFNPGAMPGGFISIGLQSDGKVLVGNYSGILRLNADGSLDTTFSASITSFDYYDGVYSIAGQSDGKVVIGGVFSVVNGTNRSGVARLNANGSLDGSFNPGTGLQGSVFSIALQPDGKVLIGGIVVVNGTNFNRIARLNANGSLDSSFNPGTGTDGYVLSVALQPDGRILIGGYFTLARLNANGSPDSSFNAPVLTSVTGDYSTVYSLALQADGKVLIGGAFYAVNFTNRTYIARLNADGSPDGSFNPGAGEDSYVLSVAVQPDGRVFVGGSFNVNVTKSSNIVRLNADGTRDASFQPGTALAGPFTALVVQPDGKVLIGGRPNTFMNGTNRYGSARLNADGSLDSTFISSTNFNPNLAALNQSNDCPPGYNCTTYTETTAIQVQPDGKVLLGGNFVTIAWGHEEGEETTYYFRYFLARFNADGSRDSSFNIGAGIIVTWGNLVALQPDGKVLLAANLTVNSASRGMARLNTDGSLDSTFNPGIGISGLGVNSMAVQSDGKVLIGGHPYIYILSGTNRHAIARLNANGSLDSTFNPTTGANDTVQSLTIQPDGKVLIAGALYSINSTNPNTVARLNANGSLDTNFHNPITDGNSYVMTVAVQSDGNVLIGGDFTIVDGVARPRVARLYGDSVAPSVNIARSNAFVIVSWPVTGLNFQLQENTDLSLPNSWSLVAQPAVTNAGQISVNVPTAVGSKFFRLKSQ